MGDSGSLLSPLLTLPSISGEGGLGVALQGSDAHEPEDVKILKST